MKNIKLIASDLDGTLIEKIKLTDYSKNVLNKLIEAGYYFCCVTGRNRKMCEDTIKVNNLYYICMNGNSVYCDNKLLLKHNDITKEDIEFFINNSKKYKYNLVLLNDRHFAIVTDEFGIERKRRMEIFGPDMFIKSGEEFNEKFMKVELYFPNENDVEKFYNYLISLKKYSVVRSSSNSLEVQYFGINKGATLKWLCDYLNIDKEEVLVLGDTENDLEMLEEFPNSVAPQNAIDSVKKIAKEICDDCTNSGVAKFLERRFL